MSAMFYSDEVFCPCDIFLVAQRFHRDDSKYANIAHVTSLLATASASRLYSHNICSYNSENIIIIIAIAVGGFVVFV